MFKINAENIIQSMKNGFVSGLGAQAPKDISLFNGQQQGGEDFSFTQKINVKKRAKKTENQPNLKLIFWQEFTTRYTP